MYCTVVRQCFFGFGFWQNEEIKDTHTVNMSFVLVVVMTSVYSKILP